MQTTTHYGLQKPDPNDTYNKATDNSNMDAIDAQMYANAQTGIPYATDTSAAANAVTASITPAPASYTDGLAVCVKIANTSTGASTLNLNGLGAVAIKNGDGTAVGSGDLVAGVPVTLRYVGGGSPAFIASGSGGLSGTGNATAADVRVNKIFTSQGGKAQIGTLADHGTISPVTPGPTAQQLAAGIYNQITINAVTFDATKVLTGTTIAGTAGTMPNNGAWNATPGPNPIAIPTGWHSGAGSVAAVTFDASKLLAGTTVAGTAGTMPEQGSPTVTLNGTQQTLAAGHYGGITVPAGVRSANGTFVPPTTGATSQNGYAQGGSRSYNEYAATVNGLAFTPSLVVVINPSNSEVTVLTSKQNLAQGTGSGSYNQVSVNAWLASTVQGFFTDNGSLFSGGFTIYQLTGGNTSYWYAFE